MPKPPDTVIGGHRILRTLGVGGAGTVYLAQHPRLQRSVALKVLQDSFAADPRIRAEFDREVELITQLSHPNIVHVYDRNGPDDEHLWLSMHHIEGGDLTTLTTAGVPPDLPRIVRLVTDVARALDHAHNHAVLHRDVKPANILLDPHPDAIDSIEDHPLAVEVVDGVTNSPREGKNAAFAWCQADGSRSPRRTTLSTGWGRSASRSRAATPKGGTSTRSRRLTQWP